MAPSQGLGQISSLTRLELRLDHTSMRHQVPGHELAVLSSLVGLRHLDVQACLANPLPPRALSCLVLLTSLALKVPLTWGASGMMRLEGQHLGACKALSELSLTNVALAHSAPEAEQAWRQLACLRLKNVELAGASPSGSALGTLPSLPRLETVAIEWGNAACCPRSVHSVLGRCTALRHLELGLWRLAQLPQLQPSLTSLALHFPCATAPPAASTLSGLRRLDVSYCSELVPWVIEAASLMPLCQLSMRRCGLEVLPAALAESSSLQELSLEGNRLSGLPQIGRYLECLQRLSLRSNRFARVPRALGAASALTWLDLSDNERLHWDIAGLRMLVGLPRLERFNY
jgi:Leucine-rich repeat (LRR) protein